MAFVSQLFGSTPQNADLQKGATQEQATQLYGQAQSGLNQQQAFVDATNAQNGLANQNSVYQQLAGIANGTGPSVAQDQLNQATTANVANQAALMAGQRGASQNAGALARLAAQQGAATQQQAAGQAATLRSSESLGAIGQMGSLATQQVGQQQNALNSLNQYTQGAQGNVLGALGNYNNASVANAKQYNDATSNNAKFTAGVIGGVGGSLGGVGSLFKSAGGSTGALAGGADASAFASPTTMMAAHGGMIPEPSHIQKLRERTQAKAAPNMMSAGGPVPGQAQVEGDSSKNDTVPTMLSPGEIVIPRSILDSKDPAEAAKKFVELVLSGKGPSPKEANAKQALADGGTVQPTTPPFDAAMSWLGDLPGKWADASSKAPSAFVGNGLDSSAKDASGPTAAPQMPQDPSMGSLDQSQAPQAPQAQQMPQFQQQTPMQAPQDSDPMGMNAYSKSMMGGFGMQQKGLMDQAKAEGRMADAQAQIAQQQAETAQKAHAEYQTHFNQLDQERQQFQQQLMSGKIDPDHYVANMGAGQKVATAIGLLLGGIGGGAGMANPAMDFLNKQIDKDIDAQKANLGKTESLLNMNMKQFGNLHDATMATKAMMADVYSAKLQQAAAASGNQAAMGRAEQGIGQLQREAAGAQRQLALSKMMMSSTNPEQTIAAMRMVDPARAKEMEGRYVPGVGMASIPVTDDTRKQIVARQDLSAKLGQLESFARTHQGSLDPKVIAAGKALAADVQNAYRTGNQMGVFKEGEQGFVEKIIDSDPTKFAAKFRTMPGYETTRRNNEMQLDSVLKAHGLHRPQIQFQQAK